MSSTLFDALQKFWGYSAFRPGQEAIVQSIAASRDTCVVMPTGGGKSLCYQLPAAMDSSRTAIVISPLIALMQDQVVQLAQMGIPAAQLNSTQLWADRQKTMTEAAAGAYRLVYLSPEMAVQPSSLAWLKQVPISFFAIDEAHCISEWGHEFRPEYRQLSRLRTLFPDTPVSAFTASATQHVRHDIVEQLQLHDPFCHVASFRRSNLRYRVRECDSDSQETLLLDAVRAASTGSMIVYVPTIARVAETVAFLEQNSIPCIGYHGKMDPADRRANQEKWMLDEPRVIVATVAFGLGINKPSVRAVIHLALPKSVEQFYQEAGRAGRDGLPSDCYLFWQKSDAAIHNFFINQIVDPDEQSRARIRYNEIRSFVDSASCRHHLICTHFGERSSPSTCSSCDNCLGLSSNKLRNSRSPQKSLPYQKPRRSGRPVPSALPAPMPAPVFDMPESGDLRDSLRAWRKATSKQREVPAFVVMHDSTLDELCRIQPTSVAALRQVSGFGEVKTQLYGEQIVAIVRSTTQKTLTPA